MIEILPIDEGFQAWPELLDLILRSFAYMNGRIDPPSSALLLTTTSLQQKAKDERGFIALVDGSLAGCMFCRFEAPDCLYLGKVAISPTMQGQGIGKALLAKAEELAAEIGATRLRLETRIELENNHEVFRLWGFVKTAENSHKGFDRVTSIEMQKHLA